MRKSEHFFSNLFRIVFEEYEIGCWDMLTESFTESPIRIFYLQELEDCLKKKPPGSIKFHSLAKSQGYMFLQDVTFIYAWVGNLSTARDYDVLYRML